ncbi:hypothetical protein J6590_088861 [Homalodisca vitripennis]|nr:hypothetical protein J6590_088861 [Homalodisca vitripennis]
MAGGCICCVQVVLAVCQWHNRRCPVTLVCSPAASTLSYLTNIYGPGRSWYASGVTVAVTVVCTEILKPVLSCQVTLVCSPAASTLSYLTNIYGPGRSWYAIGVSVAVTVVCTEILRPVL